MARKKRFENPTPEELANLTDAELSEILGGRDQLNTLIRLGCPRNPNGKWNFTMAFAHLCEKASAMAKTKRLRRKPMASN